MKGQPKSRSGCQACKIRRLRCDEGKPGCRNCAARRIACPGYQQILKWSTKYERRTAAFLPPGFNQLISAASLAVPGRRVSESRLDQSHASLSSAALERTPSPSPTQTQAAITSPGANGTLEARPPQQISTPSCPQTPRGSSPVVSRGGSTFCINASPLIKAVSDPSTFLIELWFKSVCAAWAACDSPVNPFRRLGSSLWSSSRPLFYSLQSMAAASLPDRRPEIQEIAASAPRAATEAIIQELRTLFQKPNAVDSIPSGLLISLFCLASSLCWMDRRQLGLQYLGHVRVVLGLLELRASHLSEDDRNLLGFFKECLIYEESVRSIVTSYKDDISTLLKWTPALYPPHDFVPHPWTGVPPRIVGLFGKVMALCRRSRDLWRKSVAATYEVMWQAMLDISDAQALEESLMSVEVPGLLDEPGKDCHGHDEGRRGLHVRRAAEVLRLSSLLQLYHTFPDLVPRRIPDKVNGGGSAMRSAWPTSLALHVTELLFGIPQESIRCLQPLLCLGVGTELRCTATVTKHATLLPSTCWSGSSCQPAEYLETISAGSSWQRLLDVESAREFILERLKGFGKGPAAEPIVVLRQLLQAVWARYDTEAVPGSTHWLDVMADLRYETVFG